MLSLDSQGWPDEATLHLHRPAEQYALVGDLGWRAGDTHLSHHFAEAPVGRTIDGQSHRALLIVLTDQGDAAREVRVFERRHRDQQVSGKVAGRGHGAIVMGAAFPLCVLIFR